MATSDRPKPVEAIPADLLPLIRTSGLLTDRQFEDVRTKVLDGIFPPEARALAQRLVQEQVLTEFQARRLLSNKPNGLIVGRYVIMDPIGSGSMGRVYKAHHQIMDRVVALKIIAPKLCSSARIAARFQREMRLVGRLDHPNVVRAFDADRVGDILYIVMEYVPGRSLGQVLRAGGPLPPLDMAGYAAQAALGLAHAHVRGIVHRDVKPSNLLLSATNQVKVLDLGLGVLMEADEDAGFATADGIAVGTIDYMSPEQACGKEVDGRSDIYSLGCALYHLISGRLPFPGGAPIDRLGRRLGAGPVPIRDVRPDVPTALVKVLDRMMATKPHDRYQRAEEVAEALQALIRPKAPPRGQGVRPASAPAPPSSAASSPVPAAGSPTVVPVRPDYPRWFRPLADLAETSPAGALAAVLGVALAAFGVGFAVGLMLS